MRWITLTLQPHLPLSGNPDRKITSVFKHVLSVYSLKFWCHQSWACWEALKPRRRDDDRDVSATTTASADLPRRHDDKCPTYWQRQLTGSVYTEMAWRRGLTESMIHILWDYQRADSRVGWYINLVRTVFWHKGPHLLESRVMISAACLRFTYADRDDHIGVYSG